MVVPAPWRRALLCLVSHVTDTLTLATGVGMAPGETKSSGMLKGLCSCQEGCHENATRILSLVGLIAAFTIGIDAAPAQAATYETEMVETSGAFGPSSSGWSTKATTTLTSNAPKCIRDRTVKLIAKISGENHVLDVDRSSRNGAVAVYGQRTGSHEAVDAELEGGEGHPRRRRLRRCQGHLPRQ